MYLLKSVNFRQIVIFLFAFVYSNEIYLLLLNRQQIRNAGTPAQNKDINRAQRRTK